MKLVKVVAVTAFVNEESIRRCYEVGMADVIHKPVNVETIRNFLENHYPKNTEMELLNELNEEDDEDGGDMLPAAVLSPLM